MADDAASPPVEHIPREEVFSTGRRIDADMVRGLLEAHGFDARVWGSGMGPYRLESAVTEITGVPSPFNAYRVSVPSDDVEEARALIAAASTEEQVADNEPVAESARRSPGLMNIMRSRWAIVAAALFLLTVVILTLPSQP